MNHPELSRVRSLLELDRYAEARRLLVVLLAADPDDVEVQGLLGQCHLGLDEPATALEHGQRVVALAPGQAWGHRLCAYALASLDRHAEATVAAAEAVRIDPLDWQSHHCYAVVALGVPERVRDALAAARRAVDLAPHEPDTHFLVGLVAQVLREDTLAQQAYLQTLALAPDHAQAREKLTSLRGGSVRRTARGYADALRSDPASVSARTQLDVLAFRVVRRVYWLVLAALILALLLGTSDGSLAAVSPASIVTGLVTLAGTVAYTRRLLGAIPDGVRRHVLGRLRSVPVLASGVVFTALVLAAALVASVVPGGAHVVTGLLPWVGVANVALVIWAVVWSESLGER